MNSENNDSIFSELVESLCGIRDTRQRGFALVSRLRDLQDNEISYTLKLIRERALHGHENYRLLYNSLLVEGVFSGNCSPPRDSLFW